MQAVAANVNKSRLPNYGSHRRPEVSKNLDNHFISLQRMKKDAQKKRLEEVAARKISVLRDAARPSVSSIGEFSHLQAVAIPELAQDKGMNNTLTDQFNQNAAALNELEKRRNQFTVAMQSMADNLTERSLFQQQLSTDLSHRKQK